MAGECSVAGHGQVGAFDLDTGLRPEGAGLLDGDAEVRAGVAPGVGLVGRSVGGQNLPDDVAARGELDTARRSTPIAVAALCPSPWARPTNRHLPPSGMLPSFLDIDVDPRAGVLVLVTADRVASAHVHVGRPVQLAPGQRHMHRGGGRQAPGRSEALSRCDAWDLTSVSGSPCSD